MIIVQPRFFIKDKKQFSFVILYISINYNKMHLFYLKNNMKYSQEVNKFLLRFRVILTMR